MGDFFEVGIKSICTPNFRHFRRFTTKILNIFVRDQLESQFFADNYLITPTAPEQHIIYHEHISTPTHHHMEHGGNFDPFLQVDREATKLNGVGRVSGRREICTVARMKQRELGLAIAEREPEKKWTAGYSARLSQARSTSEQKSLVVWYN